MRELHLRFPITPLALTCFGFCPSAFTEVEHKSDPLIPIRLKTCRTDQHRHPAAIFSEVIPLKRLRRSRCPYFLQRLRGSVAPFWRYQIRPAYAARSKIVSVVS